MGKLEWGSRNGECGEKVSCRGQGTERMKWERERSKNLKVGGWEAGMVRIEAHRAERTAHNELSWVKISESGRRIF